MDNVGSPILLNMAIFACVLDVVIDELNTHNVLQDATAAQAGTLRSVCRHAHIRLAPLLLSPTLHLTDDEVAIEHVSRRVSHRAVFRTVALPRTLHFSYLIWLNSWLRFYGRLYRAIMYDYATEADTTQTEESFQTGVYLGTVLLRRAVVRDISIILARADGAMAESYLNTMVEYLVLHGIQLFNLSKHIALGRHWSYVACGNGEP